MIRVFIAFCTLTWCFCSCKKDDNLSSSQYFRDVVYVVESNQPDLQITFSRGVYGKNLKGNIDQDTSFGKTGVFQFPTSVLVGVEMQLYAISTVGGDFKLKIKSTDGTVLSAIETPSFDPANQLHADRWYARIRLIP